MCNLVVVLVVIVCILFILSALTGGLEGLTKMLEEYGEKKKAKPEPKP